MKRNVGRWIWGVSLVLAGWLLSGCSTPGSEEKTAGDFLKASEKEMAWWQEARFGLFIHWGPVSLKGTEIGWSRGGERRGRSGKGSIPAEIYDELYLQFNPTNFNAREWVEVAQEAGMKYLVFTTKHHDGFSEFDSQLTDYKVTRTPFGRDVVKELAEACQEAGLRLGFYYSPPDWYHPDYRTENHAAYIRFMHGQLRELCSNYGQVDIIWFDGLGGSAEDWDSENLFQTIRELQPRILINNRAGLPGDFDTPEQRVGKFQNDRPWESCITICRQWAWKPDDKMKSLQQCLQTLVRCAGGDGNLLFNVGPMPTGEIEPRQVERLREMGAWLREYGESVYSTRGGPFKPGTWGASTHRERNIYLHLFDTADGRVTFPGIEARVVRSSVLTGGTVEVTQTAASLEVTLPAEARQEIDTIVVLTLDRPAGKIAPRGIHGLSLTSGKPARASNVYQGMVRHYGPGKAVDDDDGGTRWATDSGVTKAWLEVDLGEVKTFNRVVIREAFDRVEKFELQFQEGEVWTTWLEGTTLGEDFSDMFQPVTAQKVRLNILEASDGPTIWEFQLFD